MKLMNAEDGWMSLEPGNPHLVLIMPKYFKRHPPSRSMRLRRLLTASSSACMSAACKRLVSAATCISVSRVCSSVSRVCRDKAPGKEPPYLRPALLIGERDLGTSNERRENSDDGLDVLTSSTDRLIEAALRDMPIILQTQHWKGLGV